MKRESETAAARLLWAAGYVVDEDYYRAQIHVRGMKTLTRGQQFVSADGVVTGVRLERDVPNADTNPWSWYDNPARRHARVQRPPGDDGAHQQLGPQGDQQRRRRDGWGPRLQHHRPRRVVRPHRPRPAPQQGCRDGYAESRFIDKVTPTHVDFVLHSRPFFPTVVHITNYRFRTRMESIVKGIPLADARWIGGRLSQLSATQIGDCFRAGGFAPADVATYTQVVMRRIAALRDLPAPSIDPAVASSPRGF